MLYINETLPCLESIVGIMNRVWLINLGGIKSVAFIALIDRLNDLSYASDSTKLRLTDGI